MTSRERLGRLGIAVPEILLPGAATMWEHWAVIACDQFSSEPSYWTETRRIVGNDPSTLDLIIPECYLGDRDMERRIERANRSMRNIVERGVLKALPPGFVLVHRSTIHAPRRRGLVLAIDLEAYDFVEDSKSPIRPTEGTIRDRLPSRMALRRGAILELPHILLLIDDPEDAMMSAASAAAGDRLYDFELMQNGGRIKGRFIDENALEPLADAFESVAGRTDLLFAVGDGNHSLASAREIWREKKRSGAAEDHPARYALVEVANIHDPGLHFHPIHRVLFGVDPDSLVACLKSELGLWDDDEGALTLVGPQGEHSWDFQVPDGSLAVESLQTIFDRYLEDHPDAGIDYIHGDGAVRELVAAEPNRIGVLLPNLDKGSFFHRIVEVGPYPRKTFSIGEATEKRYYLEARRLEPWDARAGINFGRGTRLILEMRPNG